MRENYHHTCAKKEIRELKQSIKEQNIKHKEWLKEGETLNFTTNCDFLRNIIYLREDKLLKVIFELQLERTTIYNTIEDSNIRMLIGNQNQKAILLLEETLELDK